MKLREIVELKLLSVGRIAPKSVGHISRQLEFLIGKRIYDLGNFEW